VVAIRIGFVSRREEESVLLAERLMDEIESWNSGVQILADEDLALKIGRPPSSVQEMERLKVDFIVSIE